jgi:hypothetical protein
MKNDCGWCDTRGGACQDCVVTILAPRGGARHLEAEELQALSVLADAGMLPPLRLRTGSTAPVTLTALPGSRSWAFPASKAS